eukprot:m51a1_g4215 hypothetical protein (475) ;mRNA; f:76727-79357
MSRFNIVGKKFKGKKVMSNDLLRSAITIITNLDAWYLTPVSIWESTGLSTRRVVVAAGVPTSLEGPELALSPLTRNITFGWSSSRALNYVMRNTFTVLNSSAAVDALNVRPVSVRSIGRSGTVPTAPALWQASIDCSAKFTGLLQFMFFVWDANSSAVYDPIDFEIEWSCASPGCDPLCESLGRGSCDNLLGECRCSDGYTGSYCGYKIDLGHEQLPGEPFQIAVEVPSATGMEWVQVVDSDAGVEYDNRNLWTWSHDSDSAKAVRLQDIYSVNQTFQTYLPPGNYKFSFFRDSFSKLMGVEQITVLPWDNDTCTSDSDCNEGMCVDGSCACSGSRFGGHCERGCSNYTELVNHTGVAQSDQGEASLERAMYMPNNRCAWVIVPNGSRGGSWDYVHIEFDWLEIGDGDSIELWSGPDLENIELQMTFTSKTEVPRIYANVVLVGLITDIESGAAGFRLRYSTGKDHSEPLIILL